MRMNSSKDHEARGSVYPLIPLRDVVIFPSMATAILVGRQPSVNAVERAIKTDKNLVVVTQKNASVNEPGPEDLFLVGTVVKIFHHINLPDGTIKVMLEGVSRARIHEYFEEDNYFAARIEEVEIDERDTRELEALMRRVEYLFTDYVRMNPRLPNEVLLSLQSIEDRSVLADTIAAHLLVHNDEKQRLLEAFDVEERLMALHRILSEELQLLKVEKDIDEKVSSQVQKTQRELFLHEKMKAIKKELGQGEEFEEYTDVKRKIKKAGMSREAEKMAYRELDRLRMMSPMAPEATVVRNYIETLTALPWRKRTHDNLDLEQVKAKLDADHYGLAKVKERIVEFLSVVKLVGNLKGPILCFVGPPGVGKTSLGRSIADAVGRNFVRISLGGIRDEAEIRGHRRTYIGSLPGPHHPDGAEGGEQESRVSPRRDRQARGGFPGRSLGGASRGARPRSEQAFQRSFPRGRIRPERGDVHHDGERHVHDSAGASGPYGGHTAPGISPAREDRDRPEIPSPEADEGARDTSRASCGYRRGR